MPNEKMANTGIIARMTSRKKVCLLLVIAFLFLSRLMWLPEKSSAQAGSAYDLIAAVNALRSAQGMTLLTVDPILMAVAQSHSDYQASLGYWTHEGPGGTRPRDRAAAAGFGSGATIFVSENVAVLNPTASFSTLIYSIWSDALHWNTMTNASYTHAGAGITVSGNEVYYTLDVGYIAGSPGSYQPGSTYTPGGSTNLATQDNSNLISPITTSTPNPDGSVSHPVQAGHALWSIAIAYNTTINAIIELNSLDPTNPLIWPGDELLIQPSLQPSITFTSTVTVPAATRTPQPSITPRPPTPTRTATVEPSPTPKTLFNLPSFRQIERRTMGIGIIALCVLGLLVVVLTGFRRSR